jgi:hypothetical protein
VLAKRDFKGESAERAHKLGKRMGLLDLLSEPCLPAPHRQDRGNLAHSFFSGRKRAPVQEFRLQLSVPRVAHSVGIGKLICIRRLLPFGREGVHANRLNQVRRL